MNGQNKQLMLTFELLFVFFTGSVVDAESPATELAPVEVPHGTECRLLVLVFTKAISLGLSRFPVVHQSRAPESLGYFFFLLTTRLLSKGPDHIKQQRVPAFYTVKGYDRNNNEL